MSGYECNHLEPHRIKAPKDERDRQIKWHMDRLGWFRMGYCQEYYPKWLYREIGKQVDEGQGPIFGGKP